MKTLRYRLMKPDDTGGVGWIVAGAWECFASDPGAAGFKRLRAVNPRFAGRVKTIGFGARIATRCGRPRAEPTPEIGPSVADAIDLGQATGELDVEGI